MALKPPTTVPKSSPYYYLGNVAPVKPLNVPGSTTYKPTNPGWGAATNANDMSGFGYDVPGTAANPSAPYVDQPVVPRTVVTAPAQPGKWITQDYSQWIPTDWEVTGAEASGKEKQSAAEAQFQLALRRAFIDYGGDVDKLDQKYRSYIDDPTIEAAKANKFSQTAQNLAAMTKGLANQRARLGARGLTFSGANTEATRRALEARELADYSAGRTFTGGAEQGLSDLTTVGQQIRDAIANARASAAARLAAQYPAQWQDAIPEQTQTVYDTPAPVPVPVARPAAAAPKPKPKVEQPWERALRLRSEAMNRLYGLG